MQGYHYEKSSVQRNQGMSEMKQFCVACPEDEFLRTEKMRVEKTWMCREGEQKNQRKYDECEAGTDDFG